MRKTKSVALLGPASEKLKTIRQLVHEAANVFQLNVNNA